MARDDQQPAARAVIAPAIRWNLPFEATLARDLSWSLQEIQSLPAADVFELTILARQKEIGDRLWSLNAAMFPHTTADGRAKVQAQLQRQLAQLSGPAPSVYEQVTPEERVLLIGSCLMAGGDDWQRQHPRQMHWLWQQGLTPEQAREKYTAWRASSFTDSRFVPARPRKKKRKQV